MERLTPTDLISRSSCSSSGHEHLPLSRRARGDDEAYIRRQIIRARLLILFGFLVNGLPYSRGAKDGRFDPTFLQRVADRLYLADHGRAAAHRHRVHGRRLTQNRR